MAAMAKKKTATRKKAARKTAAAHKEQEKSIESWIWDAACSIRGAKDAPKYKDFILPLIFTKRLWSANIPRPHIFFWFEDVN